MIVKLSNRYPSLLQSVLAVLLLVFFFTIGSLYLFQHHQSLLTTTLNNHTEQQQRVWNSVLQGYNNGMEAYFTSIVIQEPVLELLRQAQDGDDHSTAITRVNLFRLLYDANHELLKKGVRQLHFHTTDNRSFLRFHFPHRFGDSLKDIRPTVVEVNRTLKPVVGFEGGRVVSGFRNVFPIVDGERHLGSVELSQSFETLRSSMDHLYPDSEFVLILKDAEEDKLFDEQRPLYSSSPIAAGWLVEDPKGTLHDSAKPLSPAATTIIPKLSSMAGFSAALNSGSAASFVTQQDSYYYLVTTTPIFDVYNNLAGTLISFHHSDQVAQIYQRLEIDIIVALVFFSLLALTLALIINRIGKVQAQRRQIATITEAVHSGLYVINRQGKTLYINQRACDLLGYSLAELSNSNAHELFHVHPEAVDQCPIARVATDGHKYRAEEVFKRKDGSNFPVDVGAGPVEINPGEIGAVIVFDDISERKRLETEYLQVQKMESVGILAGGVAHDFNNILSAITGFSHLILRKMPPADPLRKHIDQIVDASQRATALTRELLLFSRKQPGDFSVIDLNSLLEQVKSFLLRTLGAEIQLQIEPSSQVLPIRADGQQLQQVIINLAINARDAMAPGGSLYINSEHIDLSKPLPSYRETIPPGSYALLTVADKGCGIDAETVQHIFHPFFTTKAVGKGTGLGLAVVYGIIQQHKGFIRVESTPGEGTSFLIYLPLSDEVIYPQAQLKHQDTSLQGDETILLAEDEPMVRGVMTEILATAGYKVLSAADGAEAVRLFDHHQDQVQLLLFDIMMPQLNGKEAGDRIRQQRPDLPILYLSGYAPDSLQQRIATDLDSRCLLKPVEPEELLMIIREILNQKKPKD